MNKEMYTVASTMLEKAYVPYSHFPVGAALMTKEGKIYSGCNIENASFSMTNCAERTAFFKAISEGETEFKGLVITGETAEAISPCGACRQVMAEFCAPDMPVWLTNQKGVVVKTSVEELLPGYFKSEDMNI